MSTTYTCDLIGLLAYQFLEAPNFLSPDVVALSALPQGRLWIQLLMMDQHMQQFIKEKLIQNHPCVRGTFAPYHAHKLALATFFIPK